VELLVVIGIIALLVALILPATQNAIEGARRTRCAAKMTRLSLCMSKYDLRHGCLPGVRNNLDILSPDGTQRNKLRKTFGSIRDLHG
jgi:type II secretory pathway pseudopilin PulG